MVALDDLVRFLEHPVRGFLRQRLGVLVAEEGDELDEALAVELDGLQKWAVGDRLLRRGSPAPTPTRASRPSGAAVRCRPVRSAGGSLAGVEAAGRAAGRRGRAAAHRRSRRASTSR